MDQHLGDDDVGKTVENANREEIGMVAAVEGGTAHVQPDPGLLDSIRAALGWEAGREGAVPIDQGSIGEITDDRVRLNESAVNRTSEAGAGREAAGTGPGSEAGGAGGGGDAGGPGADRAVGAERDRRESGTEARPSPDRDDPGERDATSSAGNVDASHGVSDSRDVDRGESEERTGERMTDERATDERPTDESGTDEMQGGGEPTAAADVDAVEELDRGMEADPTEVADSDPGAGIEPDENPDPGHDAGVNHGGDDRRTDAEVDTVDDDRRTDAEIDTVDDDRRTDAEVDPESLQDRESTDRDDTGADDGTDSAERDDRRER